MKEQKRKRTNYMRVEILSSFDNEHIALAALKQLVSQVEGREDKTQNIRVAIHEAIHNAIIYAYPNKLGRISISASIFRDKFLKIKVRDWGCGINDIEKARMPLYTTGNEQKHTGMGFTIIESLVDYLDITSEKGKGTTVTMVFKTKSHKEEHDEFLQFWNQE